MDRRTLCSPCPGGDITGRDAILWGFTPAECRAGIKYRRRETLFREGVIAFFVGETKEEKKTRINQKYCKACRAAKKKLDCARC